MTKIKTVMVFFAVLFVLAACGTTGANRKNQKQELQMKGTVEVIKQGNVTIHSYMSPAEGLRATSQIIETKNKLVIIDVQYFRAYAEEVLAYSKSLGKPVDRVIVSHSHPDHWLGLEYFTGYPIYALEETKAEIDGGGDMIIGLVQSVYGEMVADKKVVPGQVISEGAVSIDGLEYQFEKVLDAEAGVQLLIKIPAVKTLVCQDIVYNDTHLFIGQKEFEKWGETLNYLKSLKGYEIVLSGHGPATDVKIFDELIEYLTHVEKVFAATDNGEDLKQGIIEKYPEYHGEALIDISNMYYLYPQAQ